MKVAYRGFEISARRERALGGWQNLYFYVMRLSDGWFLADAFTEGSDKVRDFIGHLKGRVDGYVEDPTSECDEHPADETCAACKELRERYYVDCINCCHADPDRCEGASDPSFVLCAGCGEPGVIYDLRSAA